jgi:hypothetical protein
LGGAKRALKRQTEVYRQNGLANALIDGKDMLNVQLTKPSVVDGHATNSNA